MKFKLVAVSCFITLFVTGASTDASVIKAGNVYSVSIGLGGGVSPINTSNLGGRMIKQVAAGSNHNLLLAEDGTVFSYGDNAFGITGQGTTVGSTNIATSIDTSNLGGRLIKQVATYRGHSLLLAEDGTVFGFGENSRGQLGLGATINFTSVAMPIDTSNLGGRAIKQVATGSDHSLLLAEDGTVFAFGMDLNGRTGLGKSGGNTILATPIDTTNLVGRTITQIEAGGGFSLLLADDGSVFSFGANSSGQTGLGINTGNALIATPIDTSNLSGLAIKQVSAGRVHSLLLAEDGTVFSFGDNDYKGATGQGTNVGDTLVATPIVTTNLGGRTITQVATGWDHSLLLAEDGTLFAFGDNYSYQGALDTEDPVPVATQSNMSPLGGKVITQIAGGYDLSLLIVVPEPASVCLLALGGLALLRRGR